jgi:hypothetical protein
MPFSVKRNRGSLEKWLLLGLCQETQEKPGLLVLETKKVLKNKNQQHNSRDISKEHRGQLKNFQLVIAEIILETK